MFSKRAREMGTKIHFVLAGGTKRHNFRLEQRKFILKVFKIHGGYHNFLVNDEMASITIL